MDTLLEGQATADSQSGDVPDSKLLLTHAEVAKPAMSPLNIVCASSRAAKVSLLALGDFLLAELGVHNPAKPAPLACSILHVCPDPFLWHLSLRRGVLSFYDRRLDAHNIQGQCSLHPFGAHISC